ncbi:MAG: response regulator [Saprospiraceae bacterium]
MKRVLITESTEAKEILLKNAFEALDDSYALSFVSSGEECLAYLQNSDNYDLCFILLDLNVSGVVGTDLLSRLSMEESFRTIPVIVFSENSDAEEIVKCYNDGANAYVKRPEAEEDYAKVIATITDFWGNINVLAKPEAVVEF